MTAIRMLLPLLAMSSLCFAQVRPTFEQFPAKPASDKQAGGVDLKSAPDARRFRTVLREAFLEGPKFAGNLAFAEWGCGTSCQVSAVVDMATGKVYFGPGSTGGFEYRITSRLLVTNPPSYDWDQEFFDRVCKDDAYLWEAKTDYYEWTGSGFAHLMEINACAQTPNKSLQPTSASSLRSSSAAAELNR